MEDGIERLEVEGGGESGEPWRRVCVCVLSWMYEWMV